MNLAIGTLIVPLSSLGVDEGTGDEEQEQGEEEEEEVKAETRHYV